MVCFPQRTGDAIPQLNANVIEGIVYVLDRLKDPSDEFYEVRDRGRNNLGTEIHYRQIDVTDDVNLREIVHDIGERHGRLDGLIAAAGINKEGDSLEFSTVGML